MSGGKGAIAIVGICTTLFGGRVAAQSSDSKPSHNLHVSKNTSAQEVALAIVDPKLETPFFRKTETSFPWYMVEGEDDSGDRSLENTLSGVIHSDDLVRIEKTANCISTHQGEHAMEFSNAVAGKDGVELTIFGSLPAYDSSLVVHIAPTLRFDVVFRARSPAPTGVLSWKIKKKELRLQSAKMKPGYRLRGWISVEFEESEYPKDAPSEVYKMKGPYKIEGYFKPVIQDPAIQDSDRAH